MFTVSLARALVAEQRQRVSAMKEREHCDFHHEFTRLPSRGFGCLDGWAILERFAE